MRFELSLIQLITICSIINGLVFSFLLLEKRENRKANRFLALLILALCLTFTPYMLEPVIWHRYRWLAWLPFSLSYWIGPSLYLYVRTLTSSVSISKKDGWHFAPIVLNYLHSLYHLLLDSGIYWFHATAELLESTAIVSILIYSRATYKEVSGYQHSLLNQVSTTEFIDLQWVKHIIKVLVFSFLIILLFLAISSALLGKESLDEWDEYRASILLVYAGMLYWISINGFKQAQTIVLPKLEEETVEIPKLSTLLSELQTLVTNQKLYRNPEFSLMELSELSGVSGRVISGILNRELGKNYFQFINEYRVQEVKERLQDPGCKHLTILSLALDAGFNSKASFNRVFKRYTGQTPKDFKAGNS